MKYMHSEWTARLAHWQETLRQDLYLPLGNIDVEAFLTMEHLTPEQAMQGDFAPMAPGTKWGKTYEYCWMRASVTLPEAAQGRRIVMNLKTGGETTVFVDGKSFGTYRAEWVHTPHHYIVDNCLAECGEAGKKYDILLEAYAGHFYPESPLQGCATGPVLPGAYTDPKVEGERATLTQMTYGIWNEDAYQLYMDLDTLRQLGDQAPEESLRADKIAEALERATLIADFEQPLAARIESYRAAREALRPRWRRRMARRHRSSMPSVMRIWIWRGCGPWPKRTARPPAHLPSSCGCLSSIPSINSCRASRRRM